MFVPGRFVLSILTVKRRKDYRARIPGASITGFVSARKGGLLSSLLSIVTVFRRRPVQVKSGLSELMPHMGLGQRLVRPNPESAVGFGSTRAGGTEELR